MRDRKEVIKAFDKKHTDENSPTFYYGASCMYDFLIEQVAVTEGDIDELCGDILFDEGYEKNETIKEWLEEHNIKVKK